MGVPYCIVKSKSRLGTVVHKKTATALVVVDFAQEDKHAFAQLVSAVRANYNDKFEDAKKVWGGGIMGLKSQARTLKKELAVAKSVIAQK